MKVIELLPYLRDEELLTIFEGTKMLFAKKVKNVTEKFFKREIEDIYTDECIEGLSIDLKELTHQHEDKGE